MLSFRVLLLRVLMRCHHLPGVALLGLLLASCSDAGDPAPAPMALADNPAHGLVLMADSPRARVGRDYRLMFRRGAGLDGPLLSRLTVDCDPFMARVGGYQVNLLEPETAGGATFVTVNLPKAGDAMVGCSTGPQRVGGALLYQHAKSLFFVANDALEVPVSSAAMSYRLGLRLEIVPMVDPLPLLPGDVLPVQVRFDGPELQKARILLHRARPGGSSQVVFQGTGDSVGSLDLPLEEAGAYLVTVVHVHVARGGEREVHHASLTFPIGVR